MRWLLVLMVVLVGEVREAWATCGGCCDLSVELLGWSNDGRTIAVKERLDEEPQVVIRRDGVEKARWGGGKDAICVEAKPAMPANGFAKFDIVPLESAWRDTFATRFKIVASNKAYVVQAARCTSWEVVDKTTGKAIATWARECDPNATDCIRGSIRGGYVHPSGKWLLVKTHTTACGFTSSGAYQLVRLSDS